MHNVRIRRGQPSFLRLRRRAALARAYVFALAAVLLASLSGYALLQSTPGRQQPRVVVFSAPTLAKLATDLAQLAHVNADIRRMGSLTALRLIQQGNVPDLYLSVELEIAAQISPRKLVQLGTYELELICREGEDITALKHGKLAIADPNLAPIGYRALVALYVLSQRGLLDIKEVEEGLSVNYLALPNGTVIIDASHVSASGRFLLRANIEEAAALVEQGIADCAFVYVPFVLARGYSSGLAIIRLPQDLRFTSDPPGHFIASLAHGEVAVRREGTFAASFTQAGDLLLSFLPRLNLTQYGLMAS
jgi:molybdate/tungstate transport system substrate-binding protein